MGVGAGGEGEWGVYGVGGGSCWLDNMSRCGQGWGKLVHVPICYLSIAEPSSWTKSRLQSPHCASTVPPFKPSPMFYHPRFYLV